MSQITGDLLIAISKQLPRVFSDFNGELGWTISSLTKEPTVDGEIYNIDVALVRIENTQLEFHITDKDLKKWNQHILDDHGPKYGMKGMMLSNVDLNENVKIRIERFNSNEPFIVTKVEASYMNSSPDKYRVQYISAGLGTKASGYPEFDSRYEDLLDRVAISMKEKLINELPLSSYQLIKLDVVNNWLDEDTFNALNKSSDSYQSAIKSVSEAIVDLDEMSDMMTTLNQKEFFVKESEAVVAKEEGRNVITADKLDYYLSNIHTYERIRKMYQSLPDKVKRIRHNEAAKAVMILSQSLISSGVTQSTELEILNREASTIAASAYKSEREATYHGLINRILNRILSLQESLHQLKNAYESFLIEDK